MQVIVRCTGPCGDFGNDSDMVAFGDHSVGLELMARVYHRMFQMLRYKEVCAVICLPAPCGHTSCRTVEEGGSGGQAAPRCPIGLRVSSKKDVSGLEGADAVLERLALC